MRYRTYAQLKVHGVRKGRVGGRLWVHVHGNHEIAGSLWAREGVHIGDVAVGMGHGSGARKVIGHRSTS